MTNRRSSKKPNLRVILLLGLPCSGKSFVAMRILLVFSLFMFVSRDELRNISGIYVPIKTYLEEVLNKLKKSSNEEDQVVVLDFNLKGTGEVELMLVLSTLSERYEVSVSIIETQSEDLTNTIAMAIERAQYLDQNPEKKNEYSSSLSGITPEKIRSIMDIWEVMKNEVIVDMCSLMGIPCKSYTLPPPDGKDWSRRNEAMDEMFEEFRH